MGPRAWLLCVAILAVAPGSGCTLPPPTRPTGDGTGPGLPSWAKHVKTAPVSDRKVFGQAARDIVGELGRADLVDFQMAAEQIAFTGMQSIEGGHPADAAVLLAIASYRYRQQAQHVLDVGYDASPDHLAQTSNSAYFKLLHAELQTYEHLGFADELRVIAAWLRGEDALELDADLVRRLTEIFQGRPIDEETFREAMRQHLPTAADATTETPEGAALADAFLRRLRADVGNKRKRLDAAWAMAQTPFPAFQTEALRFAWLPVPPRFCSGIADQLGAHRATVTAMLTDAKAATRAAAAVVLGMNPSGDELSALNRLRDVERHPLVRLAVAYSLARHGRREHVRDLVAALDHCHGEACLQAISLLDWLPRDILADVPEELPAALAGDDGKDWFTRMFAAGLLGRIALEHPLGSGSREALFAASRHKHEELSRVAVEAIARDNGFARDFVVARLLLARPAYRPLLARLARVATPADLLFMSKLMPRFAASDGPEAASLVEGVSALPGPEAEAQLLAWFDAYPALRAEIALRLLQHRPSSDRALDHIVAIGDGRIRLLVQLARGTPEALGALDLALRSSDPNERLFAARLAGAVGDPQSAGELWGLVNFEDDRYYPEDALLRHEGMVALLRIALAAHRPPPRPRKTMAMAVEPHPAAASAPGGGRPSGGAWRPSAAP
jgi:hypothetical protein